MKFLLPDLTGKVALVGGATSGIGKGIAYVLAGLKANVAIVARNEQLGNEVLSDLRRINPNGTYEMLLCDASNMKSIKEASEKFNSKFDKLNYLVLAQGMATLGNRNETSEGIDTKLALHYYGRVMFINILGPLLKKTAEKDEDVRVVSILTPGVHPPYNNLEDLALKKSYNMVNSANAGCFYNDLAMDQLSRDFSGPNGNRISFIHVAPGIINTNYGKNLIPVPLQGIARFVIGLFARDPEDYGRFFVQKALLDTDFGAPAAIPSTSTTSTTGNAVCSSYPAGFHLMTADGKEANVTSLHNEQYRAAVWRHTQDTLREALASK